MEEPKVEKKRVGRPPKKGGKKDPNRPKKKQGGQPGNKGNPYPDMPQRKPYAELQTEEQKSRLENKVLIQDSHSPIMDAITLQEMADIVNTDAAERKRTRYANFLLAVKRISFGVNIKDVNDMRNRFYQYVQLCALTDMKLGNMNAYSAMGILAPSAWAWKNGGAGSTPERKALIEEVDSICSGSREIYAQDSQINPVLAIFYHKNYDGLRDIQSHEVAPMDLLGDKQTPEQIAEKYKDIIED